MPAALVARADVAGDHVEEIARAIQERQHVGVEFALGAHGHRRAFGASEHGSGDVQPRGGLVAAGQHEALEPSAACRVAVDRPLEGGDVVDGDAR